ncbi:MAG: AAA family ATPase [Candidatus Aegiribacteria sp.]|nr:AAA family ATPase [Candidatus Aegiribacteria sp.]
MYLSNLKLWNFRRFGKDGLLDLESPDLDLNFTKGLNVLIGENDSGKTSIIDAIKLVLKTHSYEWLRITPEDFYKSAARFRIELRFDLLSDDEAKNFTEWLGWIGVGENAKAFLRLIYDVTKKLDDNRILPSDVRGGVDDEGYPLTAESREYLKVTYLKPLRNAQSELIPKKYSRLSQILQGHDAFKGQEETHHLVDLFSNFNTSIEKYFHGKDFDNLDLADQKGKELKCEIDRYVHSFYDKTKESQFSVVEGKLRTILEKLELSIKEEINPGLGTLNRLFMSSELLHLHKQNWDGVRLGLIEELEAHLHPQAQMRIIEFLQDENDSQLVLTTHSPNIGSKVKLSNLIICCNNSAFPMGNTYTNLSPADYSFLERFLDTTKANLFFAQGVIIVEGWAEELLLPYLAEKMKSLGIIENNLTDSGVSVVNISSTALLRFSSVFQRRVGNDTMNIPVSVITDFDFRPIEYEQTTMFCNALEKYLKKQKTENPKEFNEEEAKQVFRKNQKIVASYDQVEEKRKKEDKYNGQVVKTFVSPYWTLEYCIGLSPLLSPILFEALRQAGLEMESDGYSGKKIDVEWASFSSGKLQTSIAFDLYTEFIGYGKRISKSIIAQHFAQLLEQNTGITKTALEDDTSISYLMDAIKYASRQN